MFMSYISHPEEFAWEDVPIMEVPLIKLESVLGLDVRSSSHLNSILIFTYFAMFEGAQGYSAWTRAAQPWVTRQGRDTILQSQSTQVPFLIVIFVFFFDKSVTQPILSNKTGFCMLKMWKGVYVWSMPKSLPLQFPLHFRPIFWFSSISTMVC